MVLSISIIAIISSVLALAGAAYSWWNTRSLNRLKTSFFAGKSGVDLENLIFTLYEELKGLRAEHTVLERDLTLLQNKHGFSTQKVGLVRFNPFDDGGGNFSFTLALLDAHDTGVVITSMHGRQQSRIYAKKIQAGKSETELTEEEQQAILTANQKTKALQEY